MKKLILPLFAALLSMNALILPLSDGSTAVMNSSGSIQLHVTPDSIDTFAGYREVREFAHGLSVLHAGTGFFSGRLDLDNIGAFGHSLGGANAIEALRTDDRIDAAADLDGTMYLDTPYVIDKPMLQIHADRQESDPTTDSGLLEQGWTLDQVNDFNSEMYCC